jgi:hypothetical protein
MHEPGRKSAQVIAQPKLEAMKKILQHTILAGLFLLVTAGLAPFAMADEEGTPVPADGTPIQEEPADTDTETGPVEVVPAEPSNEPADESFEEPVEETPEYEVVPAETQEPVTETAPATTETAVTEETIQPTATTDPTPVPAVADPQAIAAKVIVVDRTANTMTIEVDGKLHLVKITPQVRILKKGKLVLLDEITSGQNIVLLARPLENGTFEVVSVAIGPAKGQAEPAGGQGKALGVGFGQRVKDNPPFFNFPNPANQLGPIISGNN